MISMVEDTKTQESAAEDIELMYQVASGEEAAFVRLVEKHQNSVIGTVAKMLGSPTEAEDIAQQVFVRVWKSAKKYKPTAKFTTYLFTITRNLVFNETRRKKVRKQVSLEEQGEEWGAQHTDESSGSPSEEYLKEELIRAVDRAIAKLPKKQRMAVVLRRYEDMPYDEIAKVLGLSVSAVKSQLFRARGVLKEELASYLDCL